MDADRPPPWFRTVADSVKDPSGATVVLLTSEDSTTRSGAGPPTGVFPGSTATAIGCLADRPPGSVAVTVAITAPPLRGVRTTMASETLALTTLASLEAAEYRSASRSGSVKYGVMSTRAALPPAVRV